MCYFHWFTQTIGWIRIRECVHVCVCVGEGMRVRKCVEWWGMIEPHIPPTDGRDTHSCTHKTESMSISTICYCLALAGDHSYWSVFVRASVCLYRMCLCKASLFIFPFPSSHFSVLNHHWILSFPSPFVSFCLSAFSLFTYYIKSRQMLSHLMFLSTRFLPVLPLVIMPIWDPHTLNGGSSW